MWIIVYPPPSPIRRFDHSSIYTFFLLSGLRINDPWGRRGNEGEIRKEGKGRRGKAGEGWELGREGGREGGMNC